MTTFLQVLVTGLGLGAAYALFAQGVVLIYRGLGHRELRAGHARHARVVHHVPRAERQAGLADRGVHRRWDPGRDPRRRSRSSSSCCACSPPPRPSRGSSPPSGSSSSCSRPSSSATARRTTRSLPFLPHDTFDWGGVRVQEQVLYIIGVTLVVTFLLWAFVRYTRVGLAITASAQNERAVQTHGLVAQQAGRAHLGHGRGAGRRRRHLLTPLTSLSTITFTLIVTVTAMAAALLGGFRSFPLTLARRPGHRHRRGGGHALPLRHPELLRCRRAPRARARRSRSC